MLFRSVTVCDMVHEELLPGDGWWHWSIPDPVGPGSAVSFNAVVEELENRIDSVLRVIRRQQGENE